MKHQVTYDKLHPPCWCTIVWFDIWEVNCMLFSYSCSNFLPKVPFWQPYISTKITKIQQVKCKVDGEFLWAVFSCKTDECWRCIPSIERPVTINCLCISEFLQMAFGIFFTTLWPGSNIYHGSRSQNSLFTNCNCFLVSWVCFLISMLCMCATVLVARLSLPLYIAMAEDSPGLSSWQPRVGVPEVRYLPTYCI